MITLTNQFKKITLLEAIELLRTHKCIETDKYYGTLTAILEDGIDICWESEYNGPYSEFTPDIDIEPPSVWARKH